MEFGIIYKVIATLITVFASYLIIKDEIRMNKQAEQAKSKTNHFKSN